MRAPKFWDAPPGIASALLAPFGAAWTAATRLRGMIGPAVYRAPVPVVCVGNLVAGGSGKTPVVLSLAAMLAATGIAAHVVTRGYGGRLAGPVRVDPTLHDAYAVGDEALLIAGSAISVASACWVARDRAAGIRAAVAAGAEAVLLDDGLQNPTVEKDLSLLVVDGEYGFGNGHVMPAGPLREPVAAGLARADAVVLIGGCGMPGELRAVPCPLLRARLAPTNGERFAGARVVAFAGIGRPGKFFATLRAVGAEIASAHPFPDHYRYTERDLDRLHDTAARAGARLVTTAKDWPRLSAARRRDVEVLEIETRWHDPAAVARMLFDVLSAPFDACERSAAVG